MNRFILDRKYAALLNSVGVSAEEVLKKAQLPEDLFNHKSPNLTATEYFRFMNAIQSLSVDEDTPIKMGAAENIETFSPPIFAAYCSKNALACFKRMARYKKLIGPLLFLVEQNEESVSLEITIEKPEYELPELLIGTEIVFLVNLIRKATKEHIVPQNIITQRKLSSIYEVFLGKESVIGERNIIILTKEDAEKPFISRDDTMWSYFEPELNRRLSEMEIDDSFAARVRSALIEILSGGASEIEDVAQKLGYSKRTLQRKLSEEKTTFQKQLNHTRELLAKQYLKSTDMTSDDVAYLLGYQELNSFLRSFNMWTGTTVSEYRKNISECHNAMKD